MRATRDILHEIMTRAEMKQLQRVRELLGIVATPLPVYRINGIDFIARSLAGGWTSYVPVASLPMATPVPDEGGR